MTILFNGIICFSLIIIASFVWSAAGILSLRFCFRKRDIRPLAEMWKESQLTEIIDQKTFEEVFIVIGCVYGIRPDKLRTDDRFDTELLQSWNHPEKQKSEVIDSMEQL